MKKYIISIIFFIIGFFSINSLSAGYELIEKDYDIAYKIEDRIIDLVDSNSSISAKKIVALLERYMVKSGRSERVNEILYVVIDDISYEYYLGEYSDSYMMSEEDCYEDEAFDEEEGICIGLKTENNLDGDEYLDEDYKASGDYKIETTYKISGDYIKLISGKSTKNDLEIWNLFLKIIPKQYRIDFKTFNIANDVNSDTYAHVEQNKVNNSKWDLTVNIALFYKDGVLNKKSLAIL